MASTDLIALRTFQTLGVTLSGVLAGATAGLSLCAVPALQLPSVNASTASQAWERVYANGKSIAVPTAIAAALCNVFVLYRATASWPTSSTAPNQNILIASIIAQLAIIPFTVVLMESGTNRRMHNFVHLAKKDALQAKGDDQKVRDELQTWKGLNLFRGIFPAIGASLAFIAALN